MLYDIKDEQLKTRIYKLIIAVDLRWIGGHNLQSYSTNRNVATEKWGLSYFFFKIRHFGDSKINEVNGYLSLLYLTYEWVLLTFVL